jgi:ATP-grasp ribosomal peptide maturase
VLTGLEDVTADLVITALNTRNVPVARVDPADIGDELSFAGFNGGGQIGWSGQLATKTRDLDLGLVRSVYHRRPSPWRFDHMPAQARDFAVAEARHGLGGLLAALPVRHVNPPFACVRAEYKPVQLQVAAELGFAVPATLVTNDVRAARAFITEHYPVVYKSFRGVPLGDDGRIGAIWTQRIEAAHLDDSLSVTAQLFQAEVEPKVADARVTVVGRQVFASLIRTPEGLLDWRAGDWAALSCTPVKVPEPVAEGMHRYLDRFGLVFGCFDFAIDDEGRWHWIECNPNGQWGFLPEADAIADAFAAVLQAG